MSCPAKINIKVKKTTTDTVKNDKYVKVRIIIHIIIVLLDSMLYTLQQQIKVTQLGHNVPIDILIIIICSTLINIAYIVIVTYMIKYLLYNYKLYTDGKYLNFFIKISKNYILIVSILAIKYFFIKLFYTIVVDT